MNQHGEVYGIDFSSPQHMVIKHVAVFTVFLDQSSALGW